MPGTASPLCSLGERMASGIMIRHAFTEKGLCHFPQRPFHICFRGTTRSSRMRRVYSRGSTENVFAEPVSGPFRSTVSCPERQNQPFGWQYTMIYRFRQITIHPIFPYTGRTKRWSGAFCYSARCPRPKKPGSLGVPLRLPGGRIRIFPCRAGAGSGRG